MKRICCVALCFLLLCGCTAQPIEQPDDGVPTSSPVVVPIGEETDKGVCVTIHPGLLGMNSEVLSDAQIADGFIDAVRNEDDSVTYTIATDRYEAFVADNLAKTKATIDETVRGNYPSVTSIEYTEDLSAITLHVIRENFEYSVDAISVFAVGTLAIMEQAYNIHAPGRCVITVLDENGAEVSVTDYPKELIL